MSVLSLPYAKILDVMCDASLKAGNYILEHYTKELVIAHKADHSPVTLADTGAQAIILALLRSHFSDIAIIAEEEVANGLKITCREHFFLVDPLDGTREFIAHNDEFTVNIALIENNTSKLGVIFIPAQQKLYVGGPDGAFLYNIKHNNKGKAIPIKTRNMPYNPVAVISRSHCCLATKHWLDRHHVTNKVALGSALKFCLIAEGNADIYPRFEPCMTWDVAAGDAIIRAAGGTLVDEKGNFMQYGLSNFQNNTYHQQGIFFAFGDEKAIQHYINRTY